MQILRDIGTLFYLISPSETAIERIEDIPKPNYVVKAIPYFLTFFVLEYVVQVLKNKRKTRINDGITSLATGLFLVSNDILGKGTPHYFYIKVYENWSLVDLPWNSPVTWWLAAIGVDFLFYWIHRASHDTK
ncbi:unnamed protein product [Orchesella dallaii]|uniref:Uncharacterized protein n=1 Tax=Orchesella dallaii TaxID=48710 RepID=A0ABP1Q9T8_9HEXA